MSVTDASPAKAPADSTPTNSISIPEPLKQGTFLTKVSGFGQKKVNFRIDADEGQILWKSSHDGLIRIESIKELRFASDGRYDREQFRIKSEYEDRWISIIYILDGVYKTLHLIAPTKEVFEMWSTTLLKLYAIRRGLMDGLGNVELREQVWERQYWAGADEGQDQKLDYSEVERLCNRLNISYPPRELRSLFQEADVQMRGYLDFSDFQRFVKLLKKRPELEALYIKLCSGNEGKFDFATFAHFMNHHQKSSLSQEELASIFVKYSDQGVETTSQGTVPPSSLLSLDGFTTFLLSADNSVFSDHGGKVSHDMSRPISEYYISSSHNTYLIGYQLVGVSTIEGYIRALLHSCRSVELDIYDGDYEPMIYHGGTLTSKVSLRDICHAIARYAFVTSPYPVIISAEVHCGVAQQDMMVKIMAEVFGDTLIQAPIEGKPKGATLPSPEDLKGKILIKAKNLNISAHAAHAVPADSSSDSDVGVLGELKELKSELLKFRAKKKLEHAKDKMSFALASLLVYTVGVKCRGLSQVYAPEEIFSLSETSANKLLKQSVTDLIKHNQTHVVRIYPKGMRVNSTNYEPHRYWSAGAQVVAINWQTFDLGYMINRAMFQRNGRSGYVLKPFALRAPGMDVVSEGTKHFLDVTIISAQQLPRMRDSKGAESVGPTIVDPLVEVSIHVPDWTNSPFLPETSHKAGVLYSPESGGSASSATSARTISFRTGAVQNNGFNPVWQEELCLPFDCVGDMKDLIFVTFAVKQEGKEDGHPPLALYCSSLGSLESGFRHLPLHDMQLSQYLFSTLFVRIGIRDIV